MTTRTVPPSPAPDGRRLPTRLYEAYIFDLDGTVYLGDRLLPGVARTIALLRAQGRVVRFLSNNPTRSTDSYVDKLTRLGIAAGSGDVVSTVTATTRWVRAHHPDAVVYPISEQPLKDALARAGVAMSSDPAEIDIVIASYDRSFEYRKLQIAFDAIWRHGRAFLVGTNPDRYCPLPDGGGEPDCAAIVAAIEACTGTTVRAVLGKPDVTIFASAVSGLDLDPADCIVVGDRPSTDIQLAHNAGADSALVLTGATTRDRARVLRGGQRPTYLLDRLDQLVPTGVTDAGIR